MNREIKVIDLVNQISRREADLPTKVLYRGQTYKFDRNIGDYRVDGCGACLLMRDIFADFDCQGMHNSFYNMLSDSVEIE